MSKRGPAVHTLIVALLALAACSNAKTPPDTGSAQAIIAILNAGGFACIDARQNVEAIMVSEDWRCTHANKDDTSVTIYVDAKQQAAVNEFLKGAINPAVVIDGPLWSVLSPDAASTSKIKALLT